MINPRIVKVKNIDKWVSIVLPSDITFEYFQCLNYNFWWNEEKSLLIDHFYILRKTNKDDFIKLLVQHPDILNLGNNIMVNTIDTFKNWYDNNT